LENPTSSAPPADSFPASPAEPGEEDTTGTSQNALEYLTGESTQTGDGTGNEPVTNPPEGTLTIQDLLNAQGVGESKDVIPLSPDEDSKQKLDKDKPDKDGDS
jgi:hypothetical protein